MIQTVTERLMDLLDRVMPVAVCIALLACLMLIVWAETPSESPESAFLGLRGASGYGTGSTNVAMVPKSTQWHDVSVKPVVNFIPQTITPKATSKAAETHEAVALQSYVSDAEALFPTRQRLEAGVNSIELTRGRSQLIKFAQPLVRISIADPTIADVTALAPDQLMVNGKQRGVTSLIVWDEFGQEGIFDLSVRNDLSQLDKVIQRLAPDENFTTQVTDDSFVISGQVSNSVILDEIRRAAAAYGYRDENFIDLTETPASQVFLKVRIAEMSRETGRLLRTSLSYTRRDFSMTRLGNSLNPTVVGGDSGTVPPVGLIPQRPINLSQSGSNVGGLLATLIPATNWEMAVDFLEDSSKINILAEPTLVSTHGRQASFLAGGEFPFVEGTDQNGSPLISFKEYGVKLNFTPWISSRSGRIELRVAPEVSSLDQSNCVSGPAGFPVCGLLKRSAETTVELSDGDTLLISGILTREEENQFQKVPFIANIPVIGNLFKNSQKSKRDRELVIVVTPQIVGAQTAGQVNRASSFRHAQGRSG